MVEDFQIFKEEVKSRCDIVDVIGEFVELKKKGTSYLGLCPFHSEKTPSFNVNRSEQFYYCFGCGKGGDVYRFLMDVSGMSFMEALQQLSDRAGLKIPERKGHEGFSREESESISAANLAAAEYFHHTLMEEKGKVALEYLLGRGLSGETVRSFRLGFAEENPDGLISFSKKKKIPESALEKAGLIVPGRYGPYRGRFSGRIIFPIFDQTGRVLGFGGRIMSGDMAKYINSPETPVYHKSHVLYGLYHAKNFIKRSGTAVVVEGYMDVISLHQAGIQNAIASSGTSFTTEQARIISRMARNTVLLFDGDKAGLSAAVRGADNLLSTDIGIGIVALPGDHDPDSFVREKGAVELKKLIDTPMDLWDFKLNVLGKEYPTVGEKLKLAGEIADSLAIIPDEMKREIYIRDLSPRIGIDVNSMTKAVNGRLRKRVSSRIKETQQVIIRATGTHGERELLSSIIRYPDCSRSFLEEAGTKAFSSPDLQKIAEVIYNRMVEGLEISPSALMSVLSEEPYQGLIASFAASNVIRESAVKIIESHLQRFREKEIKDEIKELSFRILSEKEQSQKEIYIKKQNALIERFKSLSKE